MGMQAPNASGCVSGDVYKRQPNAVIMLPRIPRSRYPIKMDILTARMPGADCDIDVYKRQIQAAHQTTSQRGGEVDSLAFTAGERVAEAVQREVSQTDIQ